MSFDDATLKAASWDAIQKSLNDLGEYCKTEPFTLEIVPDAQTLDAAVAAEASWAQNRIYELLAQQLEAFVRNVKRYGDDNTPVAVLASAPTRKIVIMLDEARGDRMFGKVYYRLGQIEIAYVPYCILTSGSTWSSVGSNIKDGLSKAEPVPADVLAQCGPVASPVDAAFDKAKPQLDAVLAEIGTFCGGGAPFTLRCEPDASSVDAAVAAESSWAQFKSPELLVQQLGAFIRNVKKKGDAVGNALARAVPNRAIVVSIDAERGDRMYGKIYFTDGNLELIYVPNSFVTSGSTWSSLGSSIQKDLESAAPAPAPPSEQPAAAPAAAAGRGGVRGRGRGGLPQPGRGGVRGRGRGMPQPGRGGIRGRGRGGVRGRGGLPQPGRGRGRGGLPQPGAPRPTPATPTPTPAPAASGCAYTISDPALLSEYEANAADLAAALTQLGETLGYGQPLKLEFAPSFDAFVAACTDDWASKHPFATSAKMINFIDNNMKRQNDNGLRAFVWCNIAPTGIIRFEIDAKRGGDMYGLLKLTSGRADIVWQAHRFCESSSSASSVAGNIGNNGLVDLMDTDKNDDYDNAEEVRKAVVEFYRQHHQSELDENLKKLGTLCGNGAPFKVLFEDDATALKFDDRIGGQRPELAGKIWETITENVKSIVNNVEKEIGLEPTLGDRIAAACPKRVLRYIILFSLDDVRNTKTSQLVPDFIDGELHLQGVVTWYFKGIAAFSSVCSDPEIYLALNAAQGISGPTASQIEDERMRSLLAGAIASEQAASGGGGGGGGGKLRTCNMCKGKGHRTCTLCHGKGCGGTRGCRGSGLANAKCSSCGGKGQK